MSHLGITIRRATPVDAAVVHAITQEAFANYSKKLGCSVAAQRESLADVACELQEKTVFLSLLDGRVMGAVRLEKKNGWGYFSRFGVRKTNRNNGLGAALINAATDWARQNDLNGLVLYTASTMLTLVRFYYSHGFYIDSTDKSQGYVRALLVKPLKEGAALTPFP